MYVQGGGGSTKIKGVFNNYLPADEVFTVSCSYPPRNGIMLFLTSRLSASGGYLEPKIFFGSIYTFWSYLLILFLCELYKILSLV